MFKTLVGYKVIDNMGKSVTKKKNIYIFKYHVSAIYIRNRNRYN